MTIEIFSDPWLARWMPLIADRSATSPVLEIGCGHGDDTVTLTRAGIQVIGFDLSPVSVAAAKVRVPTAQLECRDLRDPFPRDASRLGVVVASLSLHYFPWKETVTIVQRIWEVLTPGGVLLCRLNSTEDHHFEAGKGAQIEENFFSVEGQPKRFFDEEAITRLFCASWKILSMEHRTTHKYLRQKALWELAIEKI